MLRRSEPKSLQCAGTVGEPCLTTSLPRARMRKDSTGLCSCSALSLRFASCHSGTGRSVTPVRCILDYDHLEAWEGGAVFVAHPITPGVRRSLRLRNFAHHPCGGLSGVRVSILSWRASCRKGTCKPQSWYWLSVSCRSSLKIGRVAHRPR